MYIKFLRNLIKSEIQKQRLKLILWDIFPYYKLFFLKNMSLVNKLKLLSTCLRVDWNIVHAHKPCEMMPIMMEVSQKKGNFTQSFVEAGCWMGGSSVKFSVICKMMGYNLQIFDSFEGVQPGDVSIPESIFYGEYVGPIEVVKGNIKKYGDISICSFHKGWFENTFKDYNTLTKFVYIDCDLSKGTIDVLSGVLNNLDKTEKCTIYTQDYHILTVKETLDSDETWKKLGVGKPSIRHVARNLAVIDIKI